MQRPPLPLGARQAFRALESATTVGVTYADYSRRLIDTRVVVDDALRKIPNRSSTYAVRSEVERIMELYEFADKVWQAKFKRGEFYETVPRRV
jgi:hypothetical protein